jgi:hypothetical protein
MKVIHKYTLFPNVPTVKMPMGAKLLSADYQMESDGECMVRVWAIVDTDMLKEEREVLVVPTGGNFPDASNAWRFLDTVNIHESAIVLHVFYR